MSLFTPTLDTKSPNPFFPEHPREYIRRGIQMPFILGFNRNEGIFLLKGIVFGGSIKVLYFASFTKYVLLCFTFISFALGLSFIQCGLLRIL